MLIARRGYRVGDRGGGFVIHALWSVWMGVIIGRGQRCSLSFFHDDYI